MHVDQHTYRQLLERLNSCSDDELSPAIDGWLAAHPAERAWLAELGAVQSESIPLVTIEDRWRLYAVSRVSDTLITRGSRNPERLPSLHDWTRTSVHC